MGTNTDSGDAGGASRLAWTLDILVQLSDDAVEGYVVAAGTRIAFEGKLDAPSYVYLVQLDATQYVTVIYPQGGASVQAPAGDPARVPADGWAVAAIDGRARVVGSPVPLTRDQIAALAGGREPPPGTDKGGNG